MRFPRRKKEDPRTLGRLSREAITLRDSGAVLALIASKMSGVMPSPLEPRTLPNSVENSLYTQKVSGDVVLQASDFINISNLTNVTLVLFNTSTISGISGAGITDTVATKLHTSSSTPLNGLNIDDPASIGRHYINPSNWVIIVPKGTTLAEAQTLLVGTVIRYQLATSIDILNAYKGLWVDGAGKVGKNLFDPAILHKMISQPIRCTPVISNGIITIAATGADGYTWLTMTAGNCPIDARVCLIPVESNKDYVYSRTLAFSSASQSNEYVTFYDKDFNVLSYSTVGKAASGRQSNTFKTTATTKYVSFRIGCFDSGVTITYSDFQLELGTVATAYEPYGKNNVLLQNTAYTSSDGWDHELARNSNGDVCQYQNGNIKADAFDTTNNIAYADGSVLSAAGGKLVAVGNGTKVSIGYDIHSANCTIAGAVGKRVYVRVDATVPTGTTKVQVGTWNGSTTKTADVAFVTGVERAYTAILTQDSVGITTIRPIFRAHFADTATANGKSSETSRIMIIDLSTHPVIMAWEKSMGRQITVQECDRLFVFTASTATIKASPRIFFSADGVDTVGILPTTKSLTLIGNEDFVISAGFLTAPTSPSGLIYFDGTDGSVATERGINLYYNADGTIRVYLGNSDPYIDLGGLDTIKPNTFYSLYLSRIRNILTLELNGEIIHQAYNNKPLLSGAHRRVFTRTTNAAGTTHLGSARNLFAWLTLHRESQGDLKLVKPVMTPIDADYRDVPKSVSESLKKSGAVLSIDANTCSGKEIIPLAPRTLPNNVENAPYLQTVSDDVVFNGTEGWSINAGQGTADTIFFFQNTMLVGRNAAGLESTGLASNSTLTLKTVLALTNVKEEGIASESGFPVTLYVRINKNRLTTQDVAGFRAWLAQNPITIRYQLSAPILPLNAYRGALRDQAVPKGKNLLGTHHILGAVANAAYASMASVDGRNALVLVGKTPEMEKVLLENCFEEKVQYTFACEGRRMEAGYNGGVFIIRYTDGTFSSAIPPSTSWSNVVITSTAGKTVKSIDLSYWNSNRTNYWNADSLMFSKSTSAVPYEIFAPNDLIPRNMAYTVDDGVVYEMVRNTNGDLCEYENLVKNADFSNGTTGWIYGTSVGGGVAEYTPVAQYQGITPDNVGGNCFSAILGDRIYCRGEFQGDTGTSVIIQRAGPSYENNTVVAGAGETSLKAFSKIVTAPVTATNLYLRCSDLRTSGWTKQRAKGFFCINLTTHPVVQAWEKAMGRQITAEECERLFFFTAKKGVFRASPRKFIKTDGIDTSFVVANPKLTDITGTEGFAICFAGIVYGGGYLACRNESLSTDAQYALLIASDGSVIVTLNGTNILQTSVGVVKFNNFHTIVAKRHKGYLKVIVDGVVIKSQADATAITTKPNFTAMARSSAANGLSATAFNKVLTARLCIHRESIGDLGTIDNCFDDLKPYYMESAKDRLELARKAGTVLMLEAAEASGSKPVKLAPRTLPNGVENSDYTQKVSGDVVIADADYDTTYAGNVNNDCFFLKLFLGQRVANGGAVTIGHFDIPGMQEIANNGIDNAQSIGKYTFSTTTGKLMFVVPKGTTIEQFKDSVRGRVIRYQLATPIDTLNTYKGAWVDEVGKVGKNLFDITAPWSLASGPLTRPIYGNGFKVVGSVTGQVGYISIPYTLLPNTQYTIQATIDVVSGTGRISPRNSAGSGIGTPLDATGSRAFTTDSTGCGFFYFYNQPVVSTGTYEVNYTNIQLELGSVATTYEPYGKNNALLQNVAYTATDGWDYELVRNANGDVCQYSNIIVNADFSNGTTDYSTTTATGFLATANVAEFTATAVNGKIYQNLTARAPLDTGARYYGGAFVQADSQYVLASVSTSPTESKKFHTGGGQTELLSCIHTLAANSVYLHLKVQDTRASGWTKIKASKMFVIRLDNHPVVQAWEKVMGRQITAQECDRLFAFVTGSGSIKASPRLFFTADGADTVGVLGNTPSLDITGTEEFEIDAIFLIPNTVQTGFIVFKGLDSTTTNVQFALYMTSAGNLNCAIQNVAIQMTPDSTLMPNTLYSAKLKKQNGRLKLYLNNVLMYDQPNASSLTTQPNARLFARANNPGGTAHTTFGKLSLAWLSIHRASYGDLTLVDTLINDTALNYMEV